MKLEPNFKELFYNIINNYYEKAFKESFIFECMQNYEKVKEVSNFLQTLFEEKKLNILNNHQETFCFIDLHFPLGFQEFCPENNDFIYMIDPFSTVSGVLDYFANIFCINFSSNLLYKEDKDNNIDFFPVVTFNANFFFVDITSFGFFPKKILLRPLNSSLDKDFKMINNDSVLYLYSHILPYNIPAFGLSLLQDILCLNKEYFEAFYNLKKQLRNDIEYIINIIFSKKQDKISSFTKEYFNFIEKNKIEWSKIISTLE